MNSEYENSSSADYFLDLPEQEVVPVRPPSREGVLNFLRFGSCHAASGLSMSTYLKKWVDEMGNILDLE